MELLLLFMMQLLALLLAVMVNSGNRSLIHVDTHADTSIRMRISCLQDEPFEVDFLRYQRGGNSRHMV